MSIKKVSYGTTRIQKLRRVALDQNLLDTLGLAIGDLVRVELDTESETITIARALKEPPEQESHSDLRRSRAKR